MVRTQDTVEADSDAPEALRVRGFDTSKPHGCRISVLKGDATLSATEDDDVCLQYSPEQTRMPYSQRT